MIPIIFLVVFLVFSPAAYAVSVPVGGLAPDFTMSSIDGKAVSLSEHKGYIVVLIYWETGQKRSVQALLDCNDLSKKLGKKGVHFITMVPDTEDREEINKIVEENKIDFLVLLDSGRQVYGDYGVRVYPSTVVIDKEGRLAYDIPGHALTYKVILESQIRYMLGEIDEEELHEITNPHKHIKDKTSLEAERRYNLALRFTETRLIRQAIESAKKSIEAKPDIAKSHILLGFLYLEEENADKALEHFNKALELDSHSHASDAKTGLGGALVLKGELDKAIETLEDAVIANPYPQRAYYELGKAYELKGEQDRAAKMYKKALGKIIKKSILPSSITKCD